MELSQIKYKKITLKLYNKTITLTPTCLFTIPPEIGEENSTSARVIMYNMEYLSEIESENLTTQIPYYISDGRTNQLRANMVYPFMSFNMKDSSDYSPYNKEFRSELLFKYTIVQNINVEEIKKSIESKFTEFYTKRDGSELLKELYSKSKNSTVGITSVLRRIENSLDYIISIISSDIDLFNEDNLICYRPIYDKDNMENKFNIKYCDNSTPRLDRKDIYKKFILISLKYHIVHLIKYKFFEIESINIQQSDITRDEFNKYLSICTKSKNHENVAKYVEISIIFHKLMKTFTTHILQIIKDYDINKVKDVYPFINVDIDFENFVSNFNEFLLDKIILNTDSKNALQYTKINWGALCLDEHVNTIEHKIDINNKHDEAKQTVSLIQNKYFKYKIKYLNLKNLYNFIK